MTKEFKPFEVAKKKLKRRGNSLCVFVPHEKIQEASLEELDEVQLTVAPVGSTFPILKNDLLTLAADFMHLGNKVRDALDQLLKKDPTKAEEFYSKVKEIFSLADDGIKEILGE